MSSASKLFLPITYKKIAINQEKKKNGNNFSKKNLEETIKVLF